MEQIRYIRGDATSPIGIGNKLIVHICNNVGGWGRGFVVAISKKWKKPEQEYREWYKNQKGFELGQVQFVEVDDSITVANMIAQHNIKRINGKAPIRYEALEKCLKSISEYAVDHDFSVHMPRIGCGLAGGEWEKVEAIIKRAILKTNVQVTVYDF